MVKMSKEQSTKFDTLFEDAVDFGYSETCVGAFVDLLGDNIDHESHNLYYLATCFQEEEQQLEILEFDGTCYYDLVGFVPINSETKSIVKDVVTCLLNGGSFSDVGNITGII